MILPEVFELSVFGVSDRGIPNKERICVRAIYATNMAQFGILVGLRGENGGGIPINDNYFWFGEGNVGPNDWIFVYTGPGEARSSKLPNSDGMLHSVHWGRKTTIFNHPDILPIIIRISSVTVIDDTRRELTQEKG